MGCWYCSSNRIDVVQFFYHIFFYWSIFSFRGMSFQKSSGKFEFWCYFVENLGKFTFLKTWKAVLITTICFFITLWLHYCILVFWSTSVDVTAISKRISAESALFSNKKSIFRAKKISADGNWLRKDSLQNNAKIKFWRALIQLKSELIKHEAGLITAGIFHVLWTNAECFWDFNVGGTKSDNISTMKCYTDKIQIRVSQN